MPTTAAITLAILAWALLILLARWLTTVPVRRGTDLEASILYRTIQLYARLVHRLGVEGAEHVPPRTDDDQPPGPLIIVANHTAGIDPLLIQAALPFEPRWMMAEDMRDPLLDPLWKLAHIIFVDRAARDTRALREALRHLDSGAVLGVFPEGHLERPARHLLPFRPGVGLLIRKSRAPVLPVVIKGTPQTPTAWGSLFRTSRARVRFLPVIRYEDEDLSHDQIAADLQSRFAEATGWPDAPRAPIITPERRITLDVHGRYVDEDGNPVPDHEAKAIARTAETPPTSI